MWIIGTSGRHVTKTGLQCFLLKQSGMERAHSTSIALAKAPDGKLHEKDANTQVNKRK
jgi:hypothetical protein